MRFDFYRETVDGFKVSVQETDPEKVPTETLPVRYRRCHRFRTGVAGVKGYLWNIVTKG